MLKNYLKIAWRNLIRNRSFSLLNILGLSIGLAMTTLIVLWVNYELGVDRFHDKIDRLYEVNNQYAIEGEIWTWNSTPKPMAPAIKKDYPEVEKVTRYFYDNTFLFAWDDQKIKATGTMVDPDFLDMFSFPLIQGDLNTVLSDVNSVLVTESLAKKIFGNQDPMGKMVKIENRDTFKVTGILKDIPPNTQFTFEFLIPWSYLTQKGWDDEHWGNNSVATYVLLKDKTDPEKFSDKIATLRKNYDKDTPDMKTLLYPYSRMYLYGEFENGVEKGGRIDLIRMFGLIAIIILIIACINFMNLSTARSEKRSKEVGVRKVLGAPRKLLIGQFIGESVLITFISATFAVIIVLLLLPSFNDLVERPLSLDLTSIGFWILATAVTIFTGLLAGSYPALYLSGFKPSSVLRGTFKKVDAMVTPRKVLVILQFSVAIVLITASLIITQQLHKVQNRQLAYAKNNLIYSSLEGDMEKNYDLIKTELLESGAFTAVTKTNSPITESWSNTWGFEWEGKKEQDKTIVHRLISDDDVVNTMGLELIEGRDFDLQKYPTDSTAAILNQSALELMGFEDPIGKKIKDNGIDWHIIGVVKDFVYNSPFQKIEPMVIEGAKGWFNVIHMRMNPEVNTAQNLAVAEGIFNKYNPEYPFNYEFVDAAYAKKFNDQRTTGKLANIFTLLTIFISCLGLFGLASYVAENRIKEIGVRKVLGASVRTITGLLSKDFLKLVFISILIAIPVSWYFMNNWLEEFAFRISIPWWVYFISGGLTLLIAFLTVSFQAVKAARANPIKSLRTE
ncbi:MULTISPECIES: ABC transporter permease [Maribacter]|uniref:ABC transporter permease n=1 Tax=Maribacter flavus TaxID=1658664 RepID=A0ABU7IFJ1_9FLAO|nr:MULTISPECIES: ABC transporter permease [Maribacter]MDC6404567.1 ABC transporter permease [Maribacter sp. PR66]MEE1971710.1 ABC transporter permease [Maribacter flavus]